jgi:hypothetical protein
MSKAIDVFQFVRKNEEEYLDFAEDYIPIKAFFDGEQKSIWKKSLYYNNIFDESKNYILNEEIETVMERVDSILKMPSPYNNIKELPELNEKFLDSYSEILDNMLEPVKVKINEAEERVMEKLKKTGLGDVFAGKFKQAFKELMVKAESCNNVAKLNSFMMEADTLKKRLLNEISEEEVRGAREKPDVGGKVVPIKRQRHISIKDINPSNSWQIESKDDMERYLNALRQRLEKELEKDTILNVEF